MLMLSKAKTEGFGEEGGGGGGGGREYSARSHKCVERNALTLNYLMKKQMK